jgi:RimJ/RimL family protein N-acetyltransferase
MTIFLETDRLRLRRFTPDDADALYGLDADPDVIRWTNPDGRRAPYAFYRDVLLPRNLAFYEKHAGYGYWVAEEKATGGFLGWFHFRPGREDPDEIELGYRLQKSAWGQGYATEGSRALIRKGFIELGTVRVSATALAANRASIRVMEKAGLRLERDYIYEFTDPETGRMTEHPAVQYALDRRDFTP